MVTPDNLGEKNSKAAKFKEQKEDKTSKAKLMGLPDMMPNVFAFLDTKSAVFFARTSKEAKAYYDAATEQKDFWQTRVFQDLTEFPKLRKSETYESFYARSFYLRNRVERVATNNSLSHATWVSLFADVVQAGFEKLIPKFSGKITNYAELCGQDASPANTYLHLAAINGHRHMIIFLLDHKVPIDPVDAGYIYLPFANSCSAFVPGSGCTPLSYAAAFGHLDCIALLLAHGAKANFQSAANGDTPLHEAARGGHLDCFKLLIEMGSKSNIFNKLMGFGNTALDLARCNDTPEWEKYLREAFNVTINRSACVIA